jgi:hypothetical protein
MKITAEGPAGPDVCTRLWDKVSELQALTGKLRAAEGKKS